MNLINEYSSSDEEVSVPKSIKKFKVDSAPEVGIEDVYLKDKLYLIPGQKEFAVNLPYDVAFQPELGPQNNMVSKLPNQNVLTGIAEEQVISEFDFRLQERNFRVLGYAENPSEIDSQKFTGDITKAEQLQGVSVLNKKVKNNTYLKRAAKGDPSVIEGEDSYKGPWAGYDGETKGQKVGPTEEEFATWSASRKPLNKDGEEAAEGDINIKVGGAVVEQSTFHGKSERDYQGRTYMEYPRDVENSNSLFTREPGSQRCYAPKRSVHQFTAHPKGVTSIRYLPKTGHLLLSSGMDGKVKIWDCYHSSSLLRTYIGHTKAVRDITFDNKGSRFLSTSFDKYVKLWDTETGQVIARFSSGKTPYMSRLHPSNQNMFLTGQADKKIVQWDIRTKNKVQDYDDHMGAVSTVTFIDEGRRFVSTGDDKTMRLWEFGIPVVVKLVADPSMHSMPAVSLHPS
ncbi:hypothetical protein BB560_000399, partial [Smittium megazygosporum]